MRNLLPAMAVILAAVPLSAVAQPLEIYVPYTGPGLYVPYDPATLPRFDFPHDYVYGNPEYPSYPNFDPAAAAINAELAIHPRTRQLHLDYELADTLIRTGQTATQHYLRCQARYPTYDLASDTYLDSNGFPRRCRF